MRALVAMSGGVDSSVAAALMVERGYDVMGVTLKQWEGPAGEMPTAGCCTVGDAEDARRVAAQLDIPYYVLDHVEDFRERVVNHFGSQYLAGRTPNPCVECNRRVRFRSLLERTAALGCDVLVTGHHARVVHGERHRLLRGTDRGKDQSYVLHMLTQDELAMVELPIGEMHKSEVRQRASRLGLRTANKPDSQDICFVGSGDYRDFLREHFPASARPGLIVDEGGSVLGHHQGTADFTIGQRRGLGVSVGEPRFVVEVRSDRAEVVIGPRDRLLAGGLLMNEVTWVDSAPARGARVEVQIRYRSSAAAARVEPGRGGWTVLFDQPQEAVAPGQAAVVYSGDEVLGGGTIERVVASAVA